MFISYAQNCEDVVLWRVLRHIDNGTYVDVGAADPDEYSVTKAFYDRGWSGVNVEPAPEFVAALAARRDRDVNVAACAGDIEGPITLHYVPGTGLSTLTDDHLDTIAEQKYDIVDIETEVRRLDSILDDAGLRNREIHFLKVDVEGAEAAVLRSIDLSKWRPWVVVVEATEPTTTKQNHQSWDPILTDAGYQVCLFDGLNRFYISPDHAELAEALSYPACVFDQPYTVGAGQNELAARAEKLVAERDELMAGYARLEAANRKTLDGYARLEAANQETLDGYDSLRTTHIDALRSYASLEQQHVAAVKTFDAELAATLSAYDNQRRELEATIASYTRVESELRGTLATYEQLREMYGRSTGNYETAMEDQRRLETLNADCHRELQAMRAAFEHRAGSLEREIEVMKASRSWRITRPLRGLSRR